MSDPSAGGAVSGAVNVDQILAAHNAAPVLDPNMVYGIAQTAPDVGTAVTNAQATAAYGTATTIANNLKSYPAAMQRQAWAGYTADQQQQLIAAGYSVPKVSHSGLFSDITGAIGAAAHAIGTGLHDTGVSTVVHDVVGKQSLVGGLLHDMNVPLQQVEHVVRASALVGPHTAAAEKAPIWSMQGLEDLGKGFTSGLPHLVNPSDWAKAWDATKNGEHTYLPDTLRAIQSSSDPADFAIAKQVADYANNPALVQKWLQAMPQAQAQATGDKIQNDPTVKGLITQLMASKMSIGRAAVGEQYQLDHPAAAKAVSGIIDGTFDFFGDPMNTGIAAIQGANDARYAITGADSIDKLSQLPKVQNAALRIANYIGEHDAAGLAAEFPALKPMATTLIKSGADTPDKFFEAMKQPVILNSFLAGEGGGISKAGQAIPHIGVGHELSFTAKAATESTINWAQDKPFIGAAARTVSHVANIMPVAKTLIPEEAKSLVTFGQVARAGGLDESYARELENIYANGDVATQRNVWKGLLGTLADRTGIKDNPKLAAEWQRLIDAADNNEAGRLYSMTAADHMLISGTDTASGILAGQVLDRGWEMPSSLMLLAAKNKLTLGDKMLSVVNSDGINSFMQNGWKPMQLLRLGFAPRVAGEELAGALLRDGAGGVLKARLAASSVGGLANPDDAILPWHPLQHVWSTLADHLPESKVIGAGTNLSDFFAENLGDATRRAFRNVEGHFAGSEYTDMAKRMYTAFGDQMIPEEVSALHTNGLDRLETPENITKAIKNGRTIRVATMDTGNFTGYVPTDPLYLKVFKKQLDEVATDPLGRVALGSFSQGRDAQVQAVADYLASDSTLAQRLRSVATRAKQLPDGSMVGIDTTQEAALRDWANKVVDHVNGLVTDHEGNTLLDMPSRLLSDGKGPTVPELESIPTTRLPVAVKGPEMVEMSTTNSIYRGLLDRGFYQMVGRPMDWMARQPIFIHNAVLAQRELSGFADLGEAHMADLIMERAMARTTPYIHNPEIKSMFATNMRNLMPFWFAQEQFYKRWARTFSYAPQAFRQAQLISQGIRHSGLVHTDDQGNEVFTYPLIGQLQQDVLLPALKHLGIDVTLPVMPGFSGDVTAATPGLQHFGTPSFGPLVSMPLKAVTRIFPELAPTTQKIIGQAGASTPIWSDIVPTTISRLYETMVAQPNSSSQMASAMTQAMQYLDASGHGLPQGPQGMIAPGNIDLSNRPVVHNPDGSISTVRSISFSDESGREILIPTVRVGLDRVMTNDEAIAYYQQTGQFLGVFDNAKDADAYGVAVHNQQANGTPLPGFATSGDIQAYVNRVKNWARVTMLMRVAVGFTGPASPTINIDYHGYKAELAKLLSTPGMTLNNAVLTLVREHPDATAYTVFGSTTTSKATLPTTQATINFMDANAPFLDRYRQAGGWFVPQNAGKYDSAAYTQQILMGMRQRKDPTTFLKDIAYTEAANIYFPSLDAYEKAKGTGSNPALTAAWTTWQTNFENSHPIFTDVLNSSTAKADRAQIVTELGQALNDPAVPKGALTDSVRTLVTSLQAFQAAKLNLTGQPSAIANLEDAFATWGAGFVGANPNISGLYDRIVRPEIGGKVAASQTLTQNLANDTGAPPSVGTPVAAA